MTPGARPAPTAVAPAATVLLLRESAGELEVLVTQRAPGLAFMGGLWVFPGGRMEPADASAAAAGRIASMARLESVRRRMLDTTGAPSDATTALGLMVAACRETFEEAGVLLASRPGSDSASDGALSPAMLAEARQAASSAAGFIQVLTEHDLWLELDALVYWSHWITPVVERRRFDTRFFAVRVPPGQQAEADRTETTGHAWVGESAARERLASGEMRMAPPTLSTLEDLWSSHRRHGGLDPMLEAERGRCVPPILPKTTPVSDGELMVILPWDPAYEALPGEGAVVPAVCPDHLARLPSRWTFRR